MGNGEWEEAKRQNAETPKLQNDESPEGSAEGRGFFWWKIAEDNGKSWEGAEDSRVQGPSAGWTRRACDIFLVESSGNERKMNGQDSHD